MHDDAPSSDSASPVPAATRLEGVSDVPLPSTDPQRGTAPEAAANQVPTPTADAGRARWPRPASGRIGTYQLLEELAVGGMGVVYKAQHTTLGRIVALKTMRSDLQNHADSGGRFDREMRAAARLTHPHIVPIYEVGSHDGTPYYTMAFAAGGSLSGQRGRLRDEPRAAVGLVEKVARAVQYAHDQGVLHRDLKPGNVLLDERGEPGVSDFGLAKLQDEDAELTETGAVIGTPAYMAPEQAAGRTRAVGPSTDVWALGVILYELLTGRRPFLGDSGAEVKRRIQDEEPTPLRSLRPNLDRALERVVQKCLQKKLADRYSSAQALADDLARYLQGQPVEARPVSWYRRLRGAARRHPYRAALVLCLAGALAAGAVLLARGRPTPAPPPEPPIVLVGNRSAPQELRWVTGEKQSRVVSTPDGFQVHTDRAALLELLHAPPWDSYRLEAQIRHDAGDRGVAGLWVLGWGRKPLAEAAYDSYAAATIADRGILRGTAFRISRLVKPAQRSYADMFFQREFDSRFLPAPADPSWRTIRIDVHPEAVHVRYDQRPVYTILVPELERGTKGFFNDPPAIPQRFSPRGALGILVEDGTATFRNVVLSPYPKPDPNSPE